MFHSGKRLQLLLPMIILSCALFSQEYSPYSRFALGEPVSSSFSAPKGMGRLAAGYRDPLHINFNNPASYSNLALTTLETGFKFSTKNITDGQTGASYRAGDGFFDHLALGFPAGPKAGVSAGIVPYSEMNYNFESSYSFLPEGDSVPVDVLRVYEGSGRTYQLYAGVAYRYPKGDTATNTFSLGLNVMYIFGNLARSDTLRFQRQGFYSTRIVSDSRLNNLALNPGIQFKRRINDSLSVVIGAYCLLPVSVNSSAYLKWDRFVVSGSGSATVDTIYENSQDNDKIKIPVDIGFGATIGNANKWMAGVDLKYALWEDVELFSDEATLENSIEARIGGEFRPNIKAKSLFKISTYRLGAFYNSGYLKVDNQRIMEYGVTFGMDIPIKTMFSRMNFSFEAGNKGTTAKGLVSETFFRGYIGLTLNDKWFIKPKYD